MNRDFYGEVYNGEETYKEIAGEIKDGGQCIFGWTDQKGTHFDILMTTSPVHLGGGLQGGLRPRHDLFVCLMRIGCFGFEINNQEKHPGYVNEKLGTRINLGSSAEDLAELINGVIRELI